MFLISPLAVSGQHISFLDGSDVGVYPGEQELLKADHKILCLHQHSYWITAVLQQVIDDTLKKIN